MIGAWLPWSLGTTVTLGSSGNVLPMPTFPPGSTVQTNLATGSTVRTLTWLVRFDTGEVLTINAADADEAWALADRHEGWRGPRRVLSVEEA